MATYESLLEQEGATQSVPKSVLRDVASYFHSNEGELFEKSNVTAQIAEELDIEPELAKRAIDNLALDSVDPVVQVPAQSGPHVGVISYRERDYYYTHVDHNDVLGKQKRSVCATCVDENVTLDEVRHYTRSEEEYNREEARLLLAAHYYVSHDTRSIEEIIQEVGIDGATIPDSPTVQSIASIIAIDKIDIQVPLNTGASLLSNSTAGGNILISSANGSDLDITSLSTTGPAGTAPVSNGDGTLSMVTVDATQEKTLAQALINL